ncbi:vacuolar protein sorting-associated protein 52 homolog isoform X2 [Peromyscus leucopus]|nr:vacuolar protein sorting-associated protein 52 homolog isoform X2 [Peromyscus leucopus]XP_037055638.1 vacuolar protein sorting-associated protein 52 homolog isoform X2 [Peromyscus leucopus]
MEQMLGAFQSDLSSISSEIRTLQEQSGAMNIRLRNRQAVRGRLGELVDGLVVPSTLVTSILEAPVTEARFLEQLQELDAKAAAVREQEARGTAACADVRGVLDRLRVKAVTKIREFILQKIYSFRKPMTNYQIPQTALLKYRFFYQFLLGKERATAKEIRDEYVETLSKIYLSYFHSYLGRLMKVQYEEVAEKDHLMGVEDTAKKGFFSKPSLRSRNTIFTLGTRGAVISPTELEAPILVPHTAQRGEQRAGRAYPSVVGVESPQYPFEVLFRSQHYALLDNSCREYLFICEFFVVSGPAAHDLFHAVMGRTLAMTLKHLESYLADCYDAIAVFLCIHIVLRFRNIAAKRDVPALDSPSHSADPWLWEFLEGLRGVSESGCHAEFHQLSKWNQHHPGGADPADPALPSLPPGAGTATAPGAAGQGGAHQHSSPHGGAQETSPTSDSVPRVAAPMRSECHTLTLGPEGSHGLCMSHSVPWVPFPFLLSLRLPHSSPHPLQDSASAECVRVCSFLDMEGTLSFLSLSLLPCVFTPVKAPTSVSDRLSILGQGSGGRLPSLVAWSSAVST